MIMMSAGVVALCASPALAQSYDPSAGSGNIVGPSNPSDSGLRMPHYNSSGKIASGHSPSGAAASGFTSYA